MPRAKLTDAQWQRLEPLLPGKTTDPGRTGFDQPQDGGRDPLDCPRWRAVARLAALLRQMEYPAPALSPLGAKRGL